MSDSVAKLKPNRVIMKSEKTVGFNILVTAVEVRPNVSLVTETSGNVKRGIVVDSGIQISLAKIYAVGNCTEGYDISCGDTRVLALLPNAYMQERTAGVNMAGERRALTTSFLINSVGFLGLHIMTAESSYVTEKDGGAVYMQKIGTACKKFIVCSGLLKGYILIDKVERDGIYTSLIREQIPLDTVDFDLLKENAIFMAFSAAEREKKFGGVA